MKRYINETIEIEDENGDLCEVLFNAEYNPGYSEAYNNVDEGWHIDLKRVKRNGIDVLAKLTNRQQERVTEGVLDNFIYQL